MLVVLSDIHFQDTLNDAIVDDKGTVINIDRNVPAEAFDMIFHTLNAVAIDNKAQELTIIFAGDIFDMHRSQKWFETNYRPYGHDTSEQWGAIAERILDDIIADNRNTFAAIRKFLQHPPETIKKMEIVYIPGNHDRIINLHPQLRMKVRQAFGLDTNGNAPFPHYYRSDEYGVLVFHGHEYDGSNFSGTIPRAGIQKINPDAYDRATLGDYVTIDIGTALAYEFKHYHADKLQYSAKLRSIYCRLLEFDDVRPYGDLMEFLHSELSADDEAWPSIEPVFRTLVKKAFKSRFLKSQLGIWGKIMNIIPCRIIPPKLLVYAIGGVRSANKKPCEYALHDQFFLDSSSRFMVTGHTHSPTVEFLRKREDVKELFFINTGTWRQQIRKCVDNRTFARAKALTYVAFYKRDEDPSHAQNVRKEYSFDYWSGFTKKEVQAI